MTGVALQSLTMRPAVAGDAALLSALALRSKGHWGYSDEFIAACRQELTYTPAQIEMPAFFAYVCLNNELPVAFYVLEKISGDVAELQALFVEPETIGKGVGKMLIKHAKGQAGEQGIETIVIQGEPHAGRFYIAVGASRCGTRESGSIRGRHLPLFKIEL